MLRIVGFAGLYTGNFSSFAWLLTMARRMMSDFQVELVEDNISEFYLTFHGPKDSESAVGTGLLGPSRSRLPLDGLVPC